MEERKMTNQFKADDYSALPPETVNVPHMPVVLLLDVSGSMDGAPIQSVNLSVNRFASDVCRDPKAASAVDVTVIAFSDSYQIVQDWRPITEMKPVNLVANGGTNLSTALETAISRLRTQTHLYDEMGIEVRMPYIILLTDGYGGDVSEIAKVIKKRTQDKKMKLWVLAVKGYDKATVAELTDGVRVFELADEAGYDFSEFFNLMAVSVKAVSTSSPDQKIHIKNPIEDGKSNLKVPDLDAWLND
jgi:uncharacterized protein YegL